MRWLLLAVVAVVGLSVALLRLEREAAHEQALRRVERKFDELLAQERERAPEEYRPILSLREEAYTRMLQKIAPEEILTPSPLVTARPEWIRLHFQVDEKGECTSPQVPTGAFYDSLVPEEISAEAVEANAAVLEHVRGLLPGIEAEGIFRARWCSGELVCVRRSGELVQGFLADWPRLSEVLVEEVDVHGATIGPGFALEMPWRWTTTHTILVVVWLVVLVALKGIFDFSRKQRRFASLVTHELRSPLTTFRLYADLLAEGLVKDPEKSGEYHKTLQRESDQMARMVENVIAHSRLEEGRARLRRERITLRNLVEKAEPDLLRCADKAGVELSIDARDDVSLDVDTEAVAQILFNLVDNACKYGGGTAVHVGSSVRDGTLRLRVRDRGPGVPRTAARRIFGPFERDRGDTRGLGLGLALSRGLARDLGGDLTLEAPPDGGACFVLTLPVARAS